jgi:Arc/MetJ family transcription regulator
MKTTIELTDALFEEAKQVAASRSTTLRALVEKGLRRELLEQSKKRTFKLRDASFGGKGLRAEIAEGSWERIRELAYEGRGGGHR